MSLNGAGLKLYVWYYILREEPFIKSKKLDKYHHFKDTVDKKKHCKKKTQLNLLVRSQRKNVKRLVVRSFSDFEAPTQNHESLNRGRGKKKQSRTFLKVRLNDGIDVSFPYAPSHSIWRTREWSKEILL